MRKRDHGEADGEGLDSQPDRQAWLAVGHGDVDDEHKHGRTRQQKEGEPSPRGAADDYAHEEHGIHGGRNVERQAASLHINSKPLRVKAPPEPDARGRVDTHDQMPVKRHRGYEYLYASKM